MHDKQTNYTYQCQLWLKRLQINLNKNKTVKILLGKIVQFNKSYFKF